MTATPLHAFAPSARTVALPSPPPLALYVHIPWCVRKCPYCDFNSHELRAGLPERDYIAALVRDLESALPQVWGRKVYSIFIGGGTPSLLSADALTGLLSEIRMRLPLAPDSEITLEANPGTVEAEKFAAFRAAGVNRLSLGIQSFNDGHLKSLGRIHSAAEAQRAIEIAQQHFDNLNLDLMYALPGQTVQQAVQDVQAALRYAPQHLSCYHLTLEPNTLFYHAPPSLPDDDTSAAMQQTIEETLAAHGYQHYETSAFARPGRQARHNLNYWRFGDYLGIGAGAHSKLSFHDRVIRQAREKQPQAYLVKVQSDGQVQQEQRLTQGDLAFEFMMNALRLNQGFEEDLFQQRTGLPLWAIRRPLAEAEQRGLLRRAEGRITPTPLGQRFLNDLLQLFLEQ